MIEEYHICQTCILPQGFLGIELDSKGRCNFCSDPSYKNPNWSKVKIDAEAKKERFNDWNAVVKDMQKRHGTQDYDCVIGYSGGKDSTALLDIFINEYGLNPLCVTVDTGFLTDVAKQNIRNTLAKMNLNENHIFIEAVIPTFTRLYEFFFFNHTSHEKSLTVDICHKCTDLIHTVVVKEAMKRNLNYVIIGFSPDQIGRYFYETIKEDIIKDGIPDSQLEKILTDNDFKWYFTPEEMSSEEFPRVLYPYHVIKYDEKEIIRRIEQKGLIGVGKGDPVLTNCHVVKAALMYDLYRYGGLTYALQYAELIRQEETEDEQRKSRKDWLRLYKHTALAILNGTFNVDGIKAFFSNIGMKKEDLLATIQLQRESDPHKAQILKNLELIKTKKLK